MYLANDKKRFWLMAGSAVFGMIILIGGAIGIYAALHQSNYTQGVAIKNYDKKVTNLPDDRRQSIEAALHNVIALNVPNSTPVPNIDDATIRDGSEQQTEVTKGARYKGTFIVDIASIKQSYRINYAYSVDPNDSFAVGYPVTATCLAPGELKYGDFHCKDLLSQESSNTDPIIRLLPHATLSYTLRADTTSGNLILHADLAIASVDLEGNLAAKQQAVAMYKKEVTDWITSQGLDPSKYTIRYNYDDNGNPINT